MYRFAVMALKAIASTGLKISVLTPEPIEVKAPNLSEIAIHSTSSIGEGLSRLRPVLWYLRDKLNGRSFEYAYSPSHHALSGARHQIITIHDVRLYREPDTISQAIYHRKILPGIARRCDAVITITETSKRLLVQHFKLSPEKIFIVHAALPERLAMEPRENPAVQKPSDPFLLMVNAAYPHKNAHLVIENADAWEDRFRLVLVLDQPKRIEELKQLAKKHNVLHKVQFLRDVSDADLVGLYRQASALLFPSSDEGQGIPLVEALYFYCPVICSDLDVCREVCGDAAIYFNPNRKEEWSRAFRDFAQPGRLSILREAAKDVVEPFFEERSRAKLLEAFEAVWPHVMQRAKISN
jgi:glycosyltransferase involved in cell wall biosynthesis